MLPSRRRVRLAIQRGDVTVGGEVPGEERERIATRGWVLERAGAGGIIHGLGKLYSSAESRCTSVCGLKYT